MELRRRSPPSTTTTTTTITQPNNKKKKDDLLDSSLPFLLLLYLINGVFFTFFFFSVVYYLLLRWPENIRHSTHLHLVTFSEMAAIVSVISSFIYLLGFIHPFFSPNFRVSFEENLEEEINPISDKIHMKNTINLPEEEEIKPISDKIHIENTINYPEEEDEEVIQSVIDGKTPSYSLESKLNNCKRAASIRRKALERTTGKSLEKLPLDGFDYDSILGQCCEMPVGYVQIPVGVAGPLLLDGIEFTIPMATTEGCLVASTNRGCKAISACGGATSILLKDAMTRSPVVRFATAKRASELKFFMEELQNFDILASEFNKSSRFGRLQRIVCAIAGRNLYIRFSCSTGDAMGMNMVSKGVQNVLDYLRKDFPDMEVIGISGNYCSDKKPAAVNWIEGRGKSVVCEAIIKEEVVKNVLKTDAVSLVELNTLKNLTGSAMAGVLGGYNAHASNIVTAVYIATGQDPF